MKITADGLRELYQKYFEEKGHVRISSASVIPENDPTVLFTTAGMHPLVPYLMGQKHPSGTRLTDVQKCIRTGDIDEVGDDSHLTFFEMLGNWSLGDYFKEDMIRWSWEFLTSEKYLGLPKDKLAFTVFEGDENAPRDMESYELWRSCGVSEKNIFFLDKKHNWWGPAGQTGPCGPDTEMFVITDKEPCGENCSPACSCGRYLEIWNDVFLQYNKQQDGSYTELSQKNVDTGMGLERTIGVLTGAKSVYETEMFSDILSKIGELSNKSYSSASAEEKRAFRIVADHLRTSTFIIGDEKGVTPSNTDQGYILRRLIRRAIRFGMWLGLNEGFTLDVAEVVIDKYKKAYPELEKNRAFVLEQLSLEENRFQKTLKQGIREFDKFLNRLSNLKQKLDSVIESENFKETAEQVILSLRPSPEETALKEAIEKAVLEGKKDSLKEYEKNLKRIPGRDAFKLYDTYGFPVEMTEELAMENGLFVDRADFEERFKQHQEKSQAGAEQRFKGGLADHSEQTTMLHTATHLLHAALRKVLGDDVHQKGSNITAERLRFDFTFGRKMTPEEIKEVERLVNEAIAADSEIVMEEMTVSEAKEKGAIGLFESKYGEKVKVYTMGSFSKEICGGPHAKRTGDLGSFSIKKEESSSAGVRRIKAVVTGRA